MGKRGGIRQRMAAEDQEALVPAASAGSSRDHAPEPGTTRRRSVRQRVAAAAPAEQSDDLPLYQSLKRDWCTGEISAVKVQEYVMGAEVQGAIGMSAPARAGSAGRHPQNIHRSLLSIFKIPKGAPDMTWVKIPTKRGNVLHPIHASTSVVCIIAGAPA